MTQDAEDDWKAEFVPASAERLHRLCWQLEARLRELLYVEFRAVYQDWQEKISKNAREWKRRFERDKELHHMQTSHQGSVAYLLFNELWDLIDSDQHWELFEPFLPPRSNVQVRMEEIKTIRNRVSHCRMPHQNDGDRMALFLRDLEPGLKRFIVRYFTERPQTQTKDPVAEMLASSWQRVGYDVEMHRPDSDWLYAPQPRRSSPGIGAELTRLGPSTVNPERSHLYRLSMNSMQNKFDVERILQYTEKAHSGVIHIFVEDNTSMQITIPAILGDDAVAETIGCFLEGARECRRSSTPPVSKRMREGWPEYILWPDDYLSWYSPECGGPFSLD